MTISINSSNTLFSHSEVEESAKELQERMSSRKRLSKDEFISVIGVPAIRELIQHKGEPQAYFCSTTSVIGDCVYASIGNIDFVFRYPKGVDKESDVMLFRLKRLKHLCEQERLTALVSVVDYILGVIGPIRGDRLILALCQSLLNNKLGQLLPSSPSLSVTEKATLHLEVDFLTNDIICNG